MASLSSDITQRNSRTADVLRYFREHRNQWVDVQTLAHVGGFSGWRTRVSEARELADKAGDMIEWNRKTRESAYRLRAAPLGRDAATTTLPRWTETGAYQDDGFRLTSPE